MARLGVAGLAIAIVCGPVLPPEHVHLAGIEGRTHVVAHSHVDESFAGPSSSLVASHGDHGRAVFLTSVYDRTARLLVPHVMLPATALAPPTFVASAAFQGEVVHTIHGPPGTVWLSRGPPSFLL
jgi:hypothetical protein